MQVQTACVGDGGPTGTWEKPFVKIPQTQMAPTINMVYYSPLLKLHAIPCPLFSLECVQHIHPPVSLLCIAAAVTHYLSIQSGLIKSSWAYCLLHTAYIDSVHFSDTCFEYYPFAFLEDSCDPRFVCKCQFVPSSQIHVLPTYYGNNYHLCRLGLELFIL